MDDASTGKRLASPTAGRMVLPSLLADALASLLFVVALSFTVLQIAHFREPALADDTPGWSASLAPAVSLASRDRVASPARESGALLEAAGVALAGLLSSIFATWLVCARALVGAAPWRRLARELR